MVSFQELVDWRDVPGKQWSQQGHLDLDVYCSMKLTQRSLVYNYDNQQLHYIYHFNIQYSILNIGLLYSDQGQLGGMFTEVKARRHDSG